MKNMDNDKQDTVDFNKYNITRELVIDMLYEDRMLAKAEGKASVSLAVTKLFGDAIGMFKVADDKSVHHLIQPFCEDDRRAIEMLFNKQYKPQTDAE